MNPIANFEVSNFNISQDLTVNLNTKNLTEAKKIAKDFADMVVSFCYNQIDGYVGINPLLGGGQAEKIFRPILIEEQIRNFSGINGFGLEQEVLEQIIRQQEIANE